MADATTTAIADRANASLDECRRKPTVPHGLTEGTCADPTSTPSSLKEDPTSSVPLLLRPEPTSPQPPTAFSSASPSVQVHFRAPGSHSSRHSGSVTVSDGSNSDGSPLYLRLWRASSLSTKTLILWMILLLFLIQTLLSDRQQLRPDPNSSISSVQWPLNWPNEPTISSTTPDLTSRTNGSADREISISSR